MFVTKYQRTYWETLTKKFPPEQDATGFDISTIRSNLRLSPSERLHRMSRYCKLLKEVFPHEPSRVYGAVISLRVMAILDDYDAAMNAGDSHQLKTARWACEMLIPNHCRRPTTNKRFIKFERTWPEPR